MSDTLCGPSNPLQNLQKHTQVDRTLQQDRLVGPRHSPAQGFRSADPRAGSLDADFHAFENAQPNLFQFEQPFLNHAVPSSVRPVAPGWAADFQKLHISQPLPSHQFRTEAPLIRSAPGGWQNEFMRQRENVTGKQAVRDDTFTESQYWPSQNGVQMFNQPGPQMFNNYQTLQNQSSIQNLEHRDVEMDAQYEEAFSEAFADLEQVDQQHESSHWLNPQGSHFLNQNGIEDDYSEGLAQPKIGSDAIPYTQTKDRTAAQDTRDADDLARTAGELLNSVQHDTSTKFQNSQFLNLMRQIRDREVEVQNDDLQASNRALFDTIAAAEVSNSAPMQEELQSHDPNTFQFPDMNEVYQPSAHDQERVQVDSARTRYAGSWDYPLINDMMYFDSSQAYQTSTQPGPEQQTGVEARIPEHHAFHPGGKMYPSEASPSMSYAEMSGGIRAADLEVGERSPKYKRWTQMPNA